MDPSDPTPAQRAADADRESAADTLRAAGTDGRLTLEEMEERLGAVYTARTHPEIEALLADLRGREDLAPRRAAPGRSVPQPTRIGPEISRTIAIMSGARRRGIWRPAADTRVLTVMGESRIDLSQAELGHQITRLRVLTIMGDTTIEVPDDLHVHVTKLAVMGANDVDDLPRASAPGAPELRVRLVSIMGSAKVRFRRRADRRSEFPG